MLSADSLDVAQEQVVEAEIEVAQEVAQQQEVVQEVAQEQEVECGPNKLGDIFTFVSQGSFSDAITPLRKKNLKRYARKFMIEEGKLFYVGVKREEKREVVIEAERKRQIFLECHFNAVGGHLGQKKTVHRIQNRYYWLGIIRDVVDWIKRCETCRGVERNKSMTRIVRPQRVSAPWDFISADILGPFPLSARGHAHVLLLVDYFSKWPEASPLQRPDPRAVARHISSCVFRFGAPKTIACSQSPEFCSEVSRELRETWGLLQTVSCVDPLPDCGAPALRQAVLRLVEERPQHWDDHLDQALLPLRTSVNHSISYSPYSLVFSRHPATSSQTCSNCPHLRNIQEQQDLLRQTVLENMNTAYRQEKKKHKRKSHHTSSLKSTTAPNSSKLKRSHNTSPTNSTTARQTSSKLKRSHNTSSIFTEATTNSAPNPSKLKAVAKCGLFLGFPVQSVLAAVQSEKPELDFHLHSAQ